MMAAYIINQMPSVKVIDIDISGNMEETHFLGFKQKPPKLWQYIFYLITPQNLPDVCVSKKEGNNINFPAEEQLINFDDKICCSALIFAHII